MTNIEKVLDGVRNEEWKSVHDMGRVSHKTVFLRTMLETAVLRDGMGEDVPSGWNAGKIAESLALVCERYREWLRMAWPDPDPEAYPDSRWLDVHVMLKRLADTAWLLRNEGRTDI